VKSITGGWLARCPAHDDDKASLSISEGDDGRVLLFCHAGCSTDVILSAMNLSASSLFPPREPKAPRGRVVACYDYCDERGEVLYQCVRMEPKDFFQRRRNPDGTWTNKLGDVRRVLYRLPDLRGPVAYVVEGEKDANALAALGLVATSNMGGAGRGKWKPEYVEQLRTVGVSHVVVIPDNDEPGRVHAGLVASSCHAAGMAVKVVELPGVPDKGDVSDWLAHGHTKAELVALVKATATFTPKQEQAPVVSASAPIAAACFNLTDLGASEFFADRYGHQVRYDHRRHRWLVWSGHRWAPDADAMVYRLVSEHLRQWQRDAMEIADREKRQRVAEFALKLERRGGMDNLVAMAKSRRPITTDGKDWDTNRDIIGVQNGIVDLTTGAYRPGRPDDMVTMATNCAYDPHAEAPTWERFLASVLPDDEVRTFLQRFVGYSLTGNTDEQVLAMLYGKGSNGKSTLLSALVEVLGDYATTIAFSALEMKRSDIPSDIAGLQNLRFVMASEVKEGQRFNEARIKSLTGGDVISARHLYGEWFSFKPMAKFFLAVNHKPSVADDSYGFWRRIRLVPFEQSFTGSDRIPDLQQRLLAERDGIFQWALRGCLDWRRAGLTSPAAVDRAGYEYQDESDPLSEFLAECCEADVSSECKAGVAYSTYAKWAELRRTPKDSILRPQSFGQRFADKFERVKRASGMVYLGVRMTTEKLF
jgi:putative DNA primase/helicase